MLNEANGKVSEITNKTFRKYMEKFGLGGVHLIKGDGYLYFVTDENCDPDIKDFIDGLDSTSIYMNSFADQKPEDWARMIWDMTYGRKEKEEDEARERANAPKVFKIPRLKLQAPANEIAEDVNAHVQWVETVVKHGTIYVKIRPSDLDGYIRDLNHWANVDYKKEDFEMTMLTNLGESVNESMTADEIDEFISNAVDIIAGKLEDDFWTKGKYMGALEIRRNKGLLKDVYEITRDMYELENVTVYHFAYKNKKRIADDELFSKHISEFNSEEELAEYIINQIQETNLTNVSEKTTNSKYVQTVNEDFACGVGDVGLNQGIPHGGDGKGVVPQVMGQPQEKPKKKKKKGAKLFKEYLSKFNV